MDGGRGPAGRLRDSRRVSWLLPPHRFPADRSFQARVAVWVKGFLASHAPAYEPPEPAAAVGIADDSAPDEERILIISHGAYISALYAVLIRDFGFRSRNAKQTTGCANTCIMRVRVDYDEDGVYRGEILSWNETPHLGNVRGTKSKVDDDVRTAWRSKMNG